MNWARYIIKKALSVLFPIRYDRDYHLPEYYRPIQVDENKLWFKKVK
jgi:hypothetical protein